MLNAIIETKGNKGSDILCVMRRSVCVKLFLKKI